jgi:hypothetical protein
MFMDNYGPIISYQNHFGGRKYSQGIANIEFFAIIADIDLPWLPHGVMVAQLAVNHLVMVRIHVGQLFYSVSRKDTY